MNIQEIFDTSVLGVLNQGGASLSYAGGCMYRGLNGRKCAVGHCIPDNKYLSSIEGNNIQYRLVRDAAGVPSELSEEYSLLAHLQACHDQNAIMPEGGKPRPDAEFLTVFKDLAIHIGKSFDGVDTSKVEAFKLPRAV